MIPSSEAVRDKLITLFPRFKKQWEDPQGDGKPWWKHRGGSLNDHALFIEFSWYFLEHFNEIPEAKRQELMDFIESCITDAEYDDLDNAVCTCFLESMSNEPISKILRRYMGPKSLEVFNYWDVPEEA